MKHCYKKWCNFPRINLKNAYYTVLVLEPTMAKFVKYKIEDCMFKP